MVFLPRRRIQIPGQRAVLSMDRVEEWVGTTMPAVLLVSRDERGRVVGERRVRPCERVDPVGKFTGCSEASCNRAQVIPASSLGYGIGQIQIEPNTCYSLYLHCRQT